MPLLALVLTLGSLAAQARIEFSDEPFPGDGDSDWLACLVVDDLTGAPIAGAEVFLVKESPTPMCGEFWFTRKARTDANGWLRVPVGDISKQWHQLVLRHPDYGTNSWFLETGEVWRVGRAFDMPVLIRNWRGEPAVGAKIGFCGGCGHSPDLANAVAGADGVAVLRGIDPREDFGDLYIQHPGLDWGYDSRDWYPGDPPAIFICGFAPERSGRLVDHHGLPVVGAFVGAPSGHRGPWARTAADGSFRVLGTSAAVSRVVTKDGRECYFPPASRYPVTLKMSDPEGDDPAEGTSDVPRASRKPELVEVRYVQVSVPAGVNVNTEFQGAFERLPQPPADAVPVPVAGPFVIEIWGGGFSQRRLLFASIDQLPPEPVELQPLAPTQITARLVDAGGRPVQASVGQCADWSVRASGFDGFVEPIGACEQGLLQAKISASGLQLLELRPARDDLRTRYLWVSLPQASDDAVLDLGRIELRQTAQLTVTDEQDRALRGAVIGFARPGLQQVGDLHHGWLDDAGGWHGADLRAGDAVVVRLDEDAMPFRTVLAGDGPWRIRAPNGRLELNVMTNPLGERERVTVMLGDESRSTRGQLELRGLPHGATRLSVSAPGHRTAIVDAVVGAEAISVDVTLPAR